MQKLAHLFVIAAPSGAGKTTLVKKMVERQGELRFSVSYTTRERRNNEEDGRDYHFVSEERFGQLKSGGELLESALVFDNHYGTGRAQVHKHLAMGHDVILEIDWQGARQVRQSMPDCISIFVLPPSSKDLGQRLVKRSTDSRAVIERRLRDALSDMSRWDEFDYCIINDDLDVAVAQMEAILLGTNTGNRSDNPALQADIQRILAPPE